MPFLAVLNCLPCVNNQAFANVNKFYAHVKEKKEKNACFGQQEFVGVYQWSLTRNN